ncbi:MAG TPA: CRTAC1 family protein [Gemmata sp.]|nr:CRTAC1 family protein [Gemmata sp.]
MSSTRFGHPPPSLRPALLAAALVLVIALGLIGCAADSTPSSTLGNDQPPADEQPAGPPLFEDITASSGVSFTYRNGEDTADHLSILESLGGGVGLIDYDGDGLLDIFIPGGGGFAGADKKDIVGFPSKLFRNMGGGKFRDTTAAAGLGKLAGGKPWFYTHGVAVADYDRDGWPDLLVTGWRQVALFHNVPVDATNPRRGRTFEDVTVAAGLDRGIDWATSAAFGDLDGDGYPDLYICQYADWSWEKNPKCNYDGRTPDVCAPRHFDGLTHKLYRNTGKGKFVECSKEAGLVPGGPNASKGLGVVIVDVDGDGKPDIYVTNDTVDNFLYLNKSTRGALRFEEIGLLSGVARDDRGTPNGSMGVDAGDPEHSGRPSLWVTNYENELHALYRNDCQAGRLLFQFRTSAAGIAAIGQRYVGWGTNFLDADRDGWEDIFVTNGHAIRFPTGKDSSRKQFPVLLLNQGEGRFRDASRRIGEYAAAPRLGRGIGFGDLDNDGHTDLVISHMNEPVAILRGTGGAEHHWIGIGLEGSGHGCAVGARAVWESDGQRQSRFVKGGCSYASSGDRRLLFGLGTSRTGTLTVIWPDGTRQKFDNLAVDRYYHLVQGQEKPKEAAGRSK